jgi:predicted RND superfamily exporter protein
MLTLNAVVARIEEGLFGYRRVVLVVLAALTLAMGIAASQLRMSAGFEKLLPSNHEYIRTFEQYRDELFDANRIAIVVHPRNGDIWNAATLKTLLDVTSAVTFLPGVNRGSVVSLWTPNVFLTQITEEGFRADPLISGTITPDALTPDIIDQIRGRVVEGDYVGKLVAKDGSGAMVVAEIMDRDPRTGAALDYIDFGRLLERKIRKPFENADTEIRIIGFPKEIADIADGAGSVLKFCGIALLLTALAVFWYCRSWRLTLLPIVCSLTSLVWQFGTLHLIGFGLDPLAVLVPFLVFAIGVSHGVQQINFIVREIGAGADTYTAARRSFGGLLIPGTLALVTALVSFATMILVPIPMIRELAITASIGLAYKIVTNLVMLPLAASLFDFSPAYAQCALARQVQRAAWLQRIAVVAVPRYAMRVVWGTLLLFVAAAMLAQGRIVGSLQPGAPELRPDARYNTDALAIAGSFDVGLDWLTVVVEAPPDSCGNVELMKFIDEFGWEMRNVDGVVSVESVATLTKLYNAGLNEGQPKMATVPRDAKSLAFTIAQMQEARGIKAKDCRWLAVNLYLTDHRAATIAGVVDAIKAFRTTHAMPGVVLRLASGNAGIEAATDEVLARNEVPMMLYVYAAIIVLVFFAYRDWRAVLACCLPLTVATAVGYAFMKLLAIGLTVSTLPVMVLAAGIGVDYAFYIYNRLQLHRAEGVDISSAFERALAETGVATVFTALTLSIGVATWSFSALQFQADMGRLLTFMFLVNMAMAITVLPAFAIVLEGLFPRRGRVHVPGFAQH